jgi:hypothetical protein
MDLHKVAFKSVVLHLGMMVLPSVLVDERTI